MSETQKKYPHCVFAFSAIFPLFLIPHSSLEIPTHSVYYPTATLKQPASKQTVKKRAQKYTSTMCILPSKRLFTTEGNKQSKTIHNESVYSALLITNSKT